MSCCSNPLLEIIGLEKQFDQKSVFQPLNFCLEQGKTYALLGPSGVGKSVLFHILASLMPYDKGKILFKGQKVKPQISYMQQKDLLIPWFDVVKNAAMPLILNGMPEKEARERVLANLEAFGLKDNESLFPHQLSGGMRQRVALLRAILYEKPLLLMDEPFSALDALTSLQMRLFLKKLKQKMGLTILFITHNIDEALDLADEVFVLKGSPSEISLQLTVDNDLYQQQRKLLLKSLGVI